MVSRQSQAVDLVLKSQYEALIVLQLDCSSECSVALDKIFEDHLPRELFFLDRGHP